MSAVGQSNIGSSHRFESCFLEHQFFIEVDAILKPVQKEVLSPGENFMNVNCVQDVDNTNCNSKSNKERKVPNRSWVLFDAVLMLWNWWRFLVIFASGREQCDASRGSLPMTNFSSHLTSPTLPSQPFSITVFTPLIPLTAQSIASPTGHRCHSTYPPLPIIQTWLILPAPSQSPRPPTTHHPLSTMSQTMLLTKPLSTFLATHTSPQLPTLLLLSPTGKLLSSSSPSAASTLRTQATLACSLWTLYHPFQTTTSPLVASALPSSDLSQTLSSNQEDLNAITIQLEFGIMCIRALKSGLLFVAIGLSQQQGAGSRHTSPPASPGMLEGHGSQLSLAGELAVSEAATERSVVGSSIWGVRRQADEVGRFLEERLEGFGMSAGER
jgi:hypothetical protein